MTDTGGAPGGEGADTPTPSQGIPRVTVPGSGESKPAEEHAESPATPPRGWQPPDVQSVAQPAPPPPSPGWQPPYTGQPRWNPHGLGKPGVIALRPLNVGDILDGAITAMRRYPLLIFGIGAVMAVLSAGIGFLVQRYVLADLESLASPDNLGPGATDEELRNAVFGAFGDAFLAIVPTLFVETLLLTITAGLMAAVMGRAALGREVNFGVVWAEVRPRLLPLIGVAFAYALVTTVGVMLCFIPGAVAWTFWALAAPALVLERGTFRQAFARTVKLVSGAFWRVLGILVLAKVIESFFENIIQLPFTLGTGVFSAVLNPGKVYVPSTGDLLLASAGQIVSGTIAIPFVTLVTVIVYLDQRMRREGMDIELARAAGVQPPQAW
ncbi:membrane protein [Amycolatopsis stemonae]